MTADLSGPRWIDSHCHIYDERISGGVEGSLETARAAGVVAMIVVGCDRASSEAAIALANEHDGVYASVGLHPHEARHGVDTIVDLLERPGVIAIGEAGLDHHYDNSPPDAQRRAFAEQIRIAHERSLPLVIHTREAWDETFDILDGEGTPERTIFHCFTGGPAELDGCVGRGAYVSFSGIATFPSATDLRAAVTACPLDRMLIETDSPYLAPVPHRGRPNHPALVSVIGTAIADLRGDPVSVIADATTDNTRRVFGLP
jgi:TatD DNase family protein